MKFLENKAVSYNSLIINYAFQSVLYYINGIEDNKFWAVVRQCPVQVFSHEYIKTKILHALLKYLRKSVPVEHFFTRKHKSIIIASLHIQKKGLSKWSKLPISLHLGTGCTQS